MKTITPYILGLCLGIMLFSCSDDTEKEVIIPKICVYKLAPTCTQALNCPPRRSFYACDDKLNAFRYDLDKYEVGDCDCN